ncbi:MAG TPA: ATP-binding protein [Gemmataceae bacterium]
MISKISIRNYKCLRDVQVDLERFTVLVGPNASGKSSILQALDLLCRTFRVERPQPFDGLLQENLSRGTTEQIELAAEYGGKAYRYRTRSPSSPPTPRHNAQTKWNGDGRGVAASLAASDWKEWKPGQPGSTPLPLSVLLRLETSKLVQANPAPDPTVMMPDGIGLHSALASMALTDPDSWQRLQADLRRMIPTIRRLRHTATKPHQPSALLFDTVGGDSLPASQVSEGTLLVLGLLAALHASDRPNLVLLDDLDRGLHPKAQKELITLLRGLLETDPDLQMVATTHSPYMLDCMEVREVRMTVLKDDGSTVCAALTSHPKFPKWKDEMTPGEMWSLFGEKWVAEEVTA